MKTITGSWTVTELVNGFHVAVFTHHDHSDGQTTNQVPVGEAYCGHLKQIPHTVKSILTPLFAEKKA